MVITPDNDNLTLIDKAFREDGVKTLYKWEEYAMTRPNHLPNSRDCLSPIKRFGNTTGCVTLDPNFRALWSALHETLSPYIASGAIIGIMLGDERMWVSDTCRPYVIIYMCRLDLVLKILILRDRTRRYTERVVCRMGSALPT